MSINHNYKINIYYLKNDEEKIILNEISESKENSFALYSANNLTIEEREMVEERVNKDINKKVFSYYYDKKYVLRTVLSGAIFLFTYLFLSIVVKDPIPLVDELIISTILVVLFNLYSVKKTKDAFINDPVILLKDDLLKEVNETLLESMKEVELYLYSVGCLSKYDIYYKALRDIKDFNTTIEDELKNAILNSQSALTLKKLEQFKQSPGENAKTKILNSVKNLGFFYFLLQL